MLGRGVPTLNLKGGAKYRKNTENGHFWYFGGIFSVFSEYFGGKFWESRISGRDRGKSGSGHLGAL